MTKKLLKKYLLLASMVAALDSIDVEASTKNSQQQEYSLTAGFSNLLKKILDDQNFINNKKDEHYLTSGVCSILENSLNGQSEKQENEIEVVNQVPPTLILSYEEEPTDHFDYIENNYGDYINDLANTYGIDSTLFKALASQEYGIQSNNIVQIKKSIWNGQSITAYNFDIEDYETMKITSSCFSDPYKNLKVGCMILQYEMYELEGNILAGLQGYNYGGITAKRRIKKYAEANGMELSHVLADPYNLDWIEYIKAFRDGNYGDPNYIENVLSHIHEENYELSLKMIDGSIQSLNISNEKDKVYKKIQ